MTYEERKAFIYKRLELPPEQPPAAKGKAYECTNKKCSAYKYMEGVWPKDPDAPVYCQCCFKPMHRTTPLGFWKDGLE